MSTEKSQHIAIFGATSAIASETARIYAARGASLFLVGRSAEKLAVIAKDLEARGAIKVETACLDLSDSQQHPGLIAKAVGVLGTIDVALIAHGSLGDQKQCETDLQLFEREIRNNFTSAASLCLALAYVFESQKRGSLAVISSVAGDRGRQSNYVYGSAKGGLNVFLQGLRNRLNAHGIQVLTIKPGFVDTPMTAHLPKNALFAQPSQVARSIDAAIMRGANQLYVPWFWWGIMLIIRSIPEAVFKRLKL